MPETEPEVDEASFRVWAPGRVNLIGEHTDYSGGLVLPIAIQYGIRLAAARGERAITLESEGYGRAETVAADGSGPLGRGWARYAQAVAAELADAGRPGIGLTGTIASDLPPRAGLSSSAALEVALALALCAVADVELEPLELALLCQRAELRAVGVPCGILDQAACLLGSKGHAILLDCHSLEYRLIHVPSDAGLLIVDSGVPRSLENTAYAERRSELEEALRLVGRRSLHRGRYRCARRARRRPRSAGYGTSSPRTSACACSRRPSRPETSPLRACSSARVTSASATTTRSRSRSSTCSSSSRSTRALSAPACSAAGSAGPCSFSRTLSTLEEVGRAIAARYRERTGTGGDTLTVRASPGASVSRPG